MRVYQKKRKNTSALAPAYPSRLAGGVQYLFVKQSDDKPKRGVVQPYDPFYIVFCITVVPGAAVLFFEKFSCSIFSGKDTRSVNHAPEKNVRIFYELVNWLDQ